MCVARAVWIDHSMGRRLTHLMLVLSALLLSGCTSTTHQEIGNAGDVVVRSGPTVLGWASMGLVILIGTIVLIALFLVMPAAIVGEVRDELERRNWWKVMGLAAALPLLLALLGVIAWALAGATVLRSHGTVVIASHTRAEVEVKRTRLIGSPDARTWKYADVASIEFKYVPPTEDGPALGTVHLRARDRTRALIFEGEACPARDLAEAMRSATDVPVKVDSGMPVVTSFGALFSRLRCGIERPWHPSGDEFPTWAIVVSVLLFVGYRVIRATAK
jgi:hypothetical protein